MPHRTAADTLLTIAELAARHDLPESTARYYCKRFLPFLPHTGEGKRRRYLPEALEIFSFIVAEIRTHKNAMTVEHALRRHYGSALGAAPDCTPQAELPPAAAVPPAVQLSAEYVHQGQAALFALLEQQTKAMESIAESLAVMNRKEVGIAALEQTLGARESEIAELRKEVVQLKSLLSTAEQVHQQDLDQMRKWLSKIAGERSGMRGQDM
jgi:DNA-binding transcriptional MerR regulator